MQHTRAYQDMQAERGWFEHRGALLLSVGGVRLPQRDHTAFLASLDEDAGVAGVAGAARLPGRVGVGLLSGFSVLEATRAASSVISLRAAPGLS